MKTFTIEDIRKWKPCYDPAKHLPESWSGTALDILKMENIPAEDRLWVVLRDSVIDPKTSRLFAVWCARQVQRLMIDSRSISAVDTAEKFANGKASLEELQTASAAASAAAWAAAWAAAMDAAWAAASAAARNAAGAAQVTQLIKMLEAQNG